MISTIRGFADAQDDNWDVLTLDEECALSSIRTIVTDLRSRLACIQAVDVERALIAAGAVRSGDEDLSGINTYLLGGACFTFAPVPNCPGSIEVNFIRFSQ